MARSRIHHSDWIQQDSSLAVKPGALLSWFGDRPAELSSAADLLPGRRRATDHPGSMGPALSPDLRHRSQRATQCPALSGKERLGGLSVHAELLLGERTVSLRVLLFESMVSKSPLYD